MTACPENVQLIHALADGELDAANTVLAEAHIKSCAACRKTFEQVLAVRLRLESDGSTRYAPPELRGRIEEMLMEATDQQAPAVVTARTAPRTGWFAGSAMSALAASFAIFLLVPQLTARGIEDQFIDSHVRSQLASHLTDVATSDRHVVKPWFNGKIDFAPPVIDLADQGFPLAGGRLDYADGRVVAAIVYRRRLHTINLFVRPSSAIVPVISLSAARSGYSLSRWTSGGLEYWAVSDISPAELGRFAELFRDRAQHDVQR